MAASLAEMTGKEKGSLLGDLKAYMSAVMKVLQMAAWLDVRKAAEWVWMMDVRTVACLVARLAAGKVAPLVALLAAEMAVQLVVELVDALVELLVAEKAAQLAVALADTSAGRLETLLAPKTAPH